MRSDFEGSGLRRLARLSGDAGQTRRLLALAAIYDGSTRGAAARLGGVTLQIVRFGGSGNCPGDSFPDERVMKFNAGGPDGLINRKAPGQPSRLQDAHRKAPGAIMDLGPDPAVHGVVRWRVIELCQWLMGVHGISIAEPTLSRELRKMGYRKLSARPRHHAQAEGAIAEFEKTSPPAWRRLRGTKPLNPVA